MHFEECCCICCISSLLYFVSGTFHATKSPSPYYDFIVATSCLFGVRHGDTMVSSERSIISKVVLVWAYILAFLFEILFFLGDLDNINVSS